MISCDLDVSQNMAHVYSSDQKVLHHFVYIACDESMIEEKKKTVTIIMFTIGTQGSEVNGTRYPRLHQWRVGGQCVVCTGQWAEAVMPIILAARPENYQKVKRDGGTE